MSEKTKFEIPGISKEEIEKARREAVKDIEENEKIDEREPKGRSLKDLINLEIKK